MENNDNKTQDALPLKGVLPKKIKEKAVISNSPHSPNLDELLGERRERRECAVGVRVTREMKDMLEEICNKKRLTESEVVFRILKNALNIN